MALHSQDISSVTSPTPSRCPDSIATDLISSPRKHQQQQQLEFELSAIQSQVTSLKVKIESLEALSDVKDEKLNTLTTEKEKFISDLKKQQRYNKTIKQQLDDERVYYEKEKARFYTEINKSQSNRLQNTQIVDVNKSPMNENKDSQLEKAKGKIADLRSENTRLRSELEERCEASYNMCLKFLRIKHSKAGICRMLQHLQKENQKVNEHNIHLMKENSQLQEEINKFTEHFTIHKQPKVQSRDEQTSTDVQERIHIVGPKATKHRKKKIYTKRQQVQQKLASGDSRPKEVQSAEQTVGIDQRGDGNSSLHEFLEISPQASMLPGVESNYNVKADRSVSAPEILHSYNFDSDSTESTSTCKALTNHDYPQRDISLQTVTPN